MRNKETEIKSRQVSKNESKIKQTTKSDRLVWQICISLCVIMALALTIYLSNKDMPIYKNDKNKSTYEKAKITKVYEENLKADKKTENLKKGSMQIELEILTGKHKGKKHNLTHSVSAMYNVIVKEGDRVSVRIDYRNDGGYDVSIYNYYRVHNIIGCLIVFAFVLILVGGFKGVKALIGLVFVLVSIIWILLPLTLKGFSSILVTLGIVLVGTVVSLVLIDGWTRKTRVAIIGTMGGILGGILFALIATKIMHVSTYQMEEAEALLLVTSSTKLKVKNLFLCGILISCMGAVMDVAMSIASSIEEIKAADSKISSKKLFISAMNIGRDAMGTMANTLILAFTGNSLNMMILLYSYGVTVEQLLNTDFIALEIISAIAGSIGIIVAVPLVSFVGSYFSKLI